MNATGGTGLGRHAPRGVCTIVRETPTLKAMSVVDHVGLHTTATTFPQQSFFTELEGATFVHATHELPRDPTPIHRFIMDLLFRNPATIDIDCHREAIAAFVDAQPGVTIVSSEALFGWPFENHVNFRPNAELLA